MNSSTITKLCGSVLALWNLAAAGQFADGSFGVNAGLARLFGSVNGFTARADVQVLDGQRQVILRTPMAVAFLDGRMRVDVDVTKIQGRSVTPEAVAALKQAGLDRAAYIVRPDKKVIHLLFTGARSYASTDLSPTEVELTQKTVLLQKTALGQETIDNHPCSRNKVLLKNSTGTVLLEATTWNASDLKDFPVQISVPTKDGTTLLRFSQIQFSRPSMAQFEPPNGFTKYHSPETLVLAATMKQSQPPKTAAAPNSPAKNDSKDSRTATNKK